jgi:hypothetical protein
MMERAIQQGRRSWLDLFAVGSFFRVLLLIVLLAASGCGVFQLPQCPPAKQPLFDEPAKTLDMGSKQVQCG